MGFKTGWDFEPVHIEWGMDSPLGTGVSGPLFFQTKARFSPWEHGMFAVGIAGIALTDIDRAGDPFSYAMLAHDFGFARFHVGYGYQTNGSSFLAGIDRTWKLFGRNFNLNADLAQTAISAASSPPWGPSMTSANTSSSKPGPTSPTAMP
jgi:hypothetical protein